MKINTDKINRLEVINHADNSRSIGRMLIMYQELGDFKNLKVDVQDDGRTMKILFD